MNKKYKGFNLDEMYMLHRAFIEASGGIMLEGKYSDEDCKLYSDMLNDIEDEYSVRLKGMEDKMIENEAIAQIEERLEYWDKHNKYLGGIEDYLEAMRTAVEALKEIQQYRSIGTVEECREAIYKQEPKFPILPRKNGKYWDCPDCGAEIKNVVSPQKYCSECGKRILWEVRADEEPIQRTGEPF